METISKFSTVLTTPPQMVYSILITVDLGKYQSFNDRNSEVKTLIHTIQMGSGTSQNDKKLASAT
jgi:hypothetical protein